MSSLTKPVTAGTPLAKADSPIASWLLPMSGDARIQLEKVVAQKAVADERRARPLRTLGVVARRALVEEIESKLRMIMSETVVDLIVGGWRAYGAVRQAIDKSLSQPGIDQIVPLRNHIITASRQHSLDVEVDGFQVMTLSVELAIRVQLYDAVAVVRDGHILAVRSGQARADGTVTLAGVQVAHRTLTCPFAAELALRTSGNAR
jgi:hypothetical protein